MDRSLQPPEPHAWSLDRGTLDFLYPCHFAIDAGLTILDPGPGLTRVLGQDCSGASLADLFHFEGAVQPGSIGEVPSSANSSSC